MNIKKTIQHTSLAVLSATLLIACKKPTPNVVPEPDTEFQSSKDAVWATQVISDIETQCSFMAEGNRSNHFYTEIPGTATGNQGTVTSTFDPSFTYINMGFFKSKCLDGHEREGTVFIKIDGFSQNEINTFFPRRQPDSRYTHSYGFGGFITLSEYKVDGWKIETVDGIPAVLTNEMTDPSWDPAVSPLKWTLKGRFKFTHPTDPSQNIYWEGELTKTCLNSTDKNNVFNATKNHTTDGIVKWENAKISYSGKVSGYTAGNKSFNMVINPQTELVRDFTCYAYLVGGVELSPAVSIRKQEFHPFVSGVAQLTTNDDKGAPLYPRSIYFGNEGNPDLQSQCDNTGEVEVKGISYKIDFKN
ncbi:MAG: hypothetical protein IT236_05525 [Bacteroidia bacterium]|nr:hypothetical protein [Bacteroidia bacterium]